MPGIRRQSSYTGNPKLQAKLSRILNQTLRSVVSQQNVSVTVKLRSEIPNIILDKDSYTFQKNRQWLEQLIGHGIQLNKREHSIRKAKASSGDPQFELDQSVETFAQSFRRTNINSFVAVLILKEGKRRRGSTAAVTRSLSRVIDNKQRQQIAATPTSDLVKSTHSRTQPIRIVSFDKISDEERTLLPRITAQLNHRFCRRSGGPPVDLENKPTPSTSTTTSARNGLPLEYDLLPRDEDTQGGNMDGVDEKNKVLDHIQIHWNNKDVNHIRKEIQELRRLNNYRAFTRLLPLTSGFLGDAFPDKLTQNGSQQRQTAYLRDEDTQGGDEDGVTDKLHCIAYVKAHWSNADVLDIKRELTQLKIEDKFRAFIRLFPFTSGFIKETFLDILTN